MSSRKSSKGGSRGSDGYHPDRTIRNMGRPHIYIPGENEETQRTREEPSPDLVIRSMRGTTSGPPRSSRDQIRESIKNEKSAIDDVKSKLDSMLDKIKLLENENFELLTVIEEKDLLIEKKILEEKKVIERARAASKEGLTLA